MSAWAEVDRWREERAEPRREGLALYIAKQHERAERARVARQLRMDTLGELRAFCVVEVGAKHLRFRSRPNGTVIRVERPCYYVPGKWRAVWQAEVRGFVFEATRRGFTALQAQAVLVERDRWLEQGAPRRSRLPEV